MLHLFLCYLIAWSGILTGTQGQSQLAPRCRQLTSSIRVHSNQVANMDSNVVSMNDTTADNGYELRLRRASDGVMISGWYEPGREYTMTLTNRYQMVGFRDAILWLELGEKEAQMKMGKMAAMTTNEKGAESDRCEHHPTRLGSWIHRTAPANGMSAARTMTQARVRCEGLTAERFKQDRSLIHSLVLTWRAPHMNLIAPECASRTELGCVTIHAAVRARGGHGGIYRSAGGLMKTLCPSTHRPPSPVLPADMSMSNSHKDMKSSGKPMDQQQPSRMQPSDTMQPRDCCACGTATYKLTFQGLWTRETHPRDWPIHNPGLLHWTNLIGASHMPNYHIYRMGDTASAGVSAVCTYGDTTVLKQSLGMAAASAASTVSSVPTGTQRGALGIGPLHSLISTAGMWTEETLNETRTTMIGVNRTHPTISFLSMLGPSPNWCAGLASQSVCQADCTWIKELNIDLYPWDAGVRHGDTYIPKNGDRKDVPDPIRFITPDWMPNHPFTPNRPVARVSLMRVSPQHSWECTSELADGVELFRSDGSTERLGNTATNSSDHESEGPVSSVQADAGANSGAGGLPKKSRGKGRSSSGGSMGGSSGPNPLSDPSLAQMATFLCITDTWTGWSRCSVTCGVGRRERTRIMVMNKKNELCQHVPLVEREACEGRKRTCDFSSPCSLLPWTDWTPCNATCDDRNGVQMRRRFLARPNEQTRCRHVFPNPEEQSTNSVIERRQCAPTDTECDPVTICGEGRQDGLACGEKTQFYHYSAVEHACIPFDYLGCKGGRNRFRLKQVCEDTCLVAVESLPGWRRERMALLQYQTSQIDASNDPNAAERMKNMEPAAQCGKLMDPGEKCSGQMSQKTVAWYFSSRTQRCFEFIYLGCGGNLNRYPNYTSCISDCLPKEWEKSLQMSKALKATSKRSKEERDGPNSEDRSDVENDVDSSDLNRIQSLWGPKQDCQLTKWSGWSPCSVEPGERRGSRMRWRHIIRPARHGGDACGILFDKSQCHVRRRYY